MTEPPPTTEELDDLFGRLAGGDRTAIARSFQMIRPLVHRFCVRLLGDTPDADDATQQTLERVFEGVGSYDSSRHALPWVLAIATWEVRTIRRRNWRNEKRRFDVLDDELMGTLPDPETTVLSRNLLEVIGELTESLPANDRDTMRQLLEREFEAGFGASQDAVYRKRKERLLTKVRTLLRNLGHVQ